MVENPNIFHKFLCCKKTIYLCVHSMQYTWPHKEKIEKNKETALTGGHGGRDHGGEGSGGCGGGVAVAPGMGSHGRQIEEPMIYFINIKTWRRNPTRTKINYPGTENQKPQGTKFNKTN